MTEVRQYERHTDDDDDPPSLDWNMHEADTQSTRVKYHVPYRFWHYNTKLEKVLIVGWLFLLIIVTVLIAVIHHLRSQQVFTGSKQWNLHWKEGWDSDVCMTDHCIAVSASILSNMNKSVEPCEDFYAYACGGWDDNNYLPDGYASWGTLEKLAARNQIIMRKLLGKPSILKSKAVQKALAFYASCMDVNKTADKRGAKPLLDLIEKSGGWSLTPEWNLTTFDLQQEVVMSKLNLMSWEALFIWGIEENDKLSTRYVLEFDQGGLFLSSRDYYLNATEKAVLDAYRDYIIKIATLLGSSETDARTLAHQIVEFETDLAKIMTPEEDRQDNEALYHNLTLRELGTIAPFLDWTSFVNSALKVINHHVSENQTAVVNAPEYLDKLNKLIHQKMGTFKGRLVLHNYLMWHGISNYVGFLSKEFSDAANILKKAQIGVSSGEETWRVCVTTTDMVMGNVLGAMYVKEIFNKNSRRTAEAMLAEIRKAFRKRLSQVDWMDIKTRMQALQKADAILPMIGYPDFILNYEELDQKFEDLQVSETNYFDNYVNYTKYKAKERFGLLFKEVNRTKWDMTPLTVNAYYSPATNAIVFPAGILQKPMFDSESPDALNFGAIGVVMGHELTHAFDDKGRKYDQYGNLNPWWAKDTAEKFKMKTQCMVEQYESYSLREEHLKGNLTLGENIADNGGLKASYYAFLEWQKTHTHQPKLPGLNLTPSQLFFVGFGQVWCSTITKEAAHLEILQDSHVLPQFRVRGPLSNSKEFALAFNCPLGSFMNPVKKCDVW